MYHASHKRSLAHKALDFTIENCRDLFLGLCALATATALATQQWKPLSLPCFVMGMIFAVLALDELRNARWKYIRWNLVKTALAFVIITAMQFALGIILIFRA